MDLIEAIVGLVFGIVTLVTGITIKAGVVIDILGALLTAMSLAMIIYILIKKKD